MTEKLPDPIAEPTRALACDGPCNGEYITPREAHMNGYELTQSPNGEYVYTTEIGGKS